MAQDILYTSKRVHHKGFAALTIVLVSAVLAILSYLSIQYGRTSLNVMEEKQILNSCSVGLGISIIETNNVEQICTADFLNECASSLSENVTPNFVCIDLGLECNADNQCERTYGVSSSYNPGRGETSKSVTITVPEEVHDVDLIDAAVIMLLDYSGSMGGNRIQQLKDTVSQFINSDFNLSYSVILYSSDVIVSSNIGKSPQHKQSVLSMVNNRSPGGGTNFVAPLNKAMQQITSTDYEAYYILLISDGSPNEGIGPSQSFVQNNIMSLNDDNCIYSTNVNPCITVYTLGVDNANTNALQSISGNTLNTAPNEFSFIVNANQVAEAFNAIIEEIMCRIGPVIADGDLNVFNDTQILEEGTDYLYDNLYKILKFYDVEPFNVCTNMLNNNAQITLRWGRPSLNAQ
jgi:uncharacterized protein YegL